MVDYLLDRNHELISTIGSIKKLYDPILEKKIIEEENRIESKKITVLKRKRGMSQSINDDISYLSMSSNPRFAIPRGSYLAEPGDMFQKGIREDPRASKIKRVSAFKDSTFLSFPQSMLGISYTGNSPIHSNKPPLEKTLEPAVDILYNFLTKDTIEEDYETSIGDIEYKVNNYKIVFYNTVSKEDEPIKNMKLKDHIKNSLMLVVGCIFSKFKVITLIVLITWCMFCPS